MHELSVHPQPPYTYRRTVVFYLLKGKELFGCRTPEGHSLEFHFLILSGKIIYKVCYTLKRDQVCTLTFNSNWKLGRHFWPYFSSWLSVKTLLPHNPYHWPWEYVQKFLKNCELREKMKIRWRKPCSAFFRRRLKEAREFWTYKLWKLAQF